MGKYPYIWRAEAPGQGLCPTPLQGRHQAGTCPVPEWPECQSSCMATNLPTPVPSELLQEAVLGFQGETLSK